jgi:hypothetical protein
MDEELENLAQQYALKRGIVLGERLGFGIHGIVYAAEDNVKPGFFAVKFHREDIPFERECRVYQRLRERRVCRILDFNLPQLLRTDETSKAIEMTVVARPFVLDFAGAFLDEPPEFSEDVLHQWEKDKQEVFGQRWAKIGEVLAALRVYGIHLLDINPGNITFRHRLG